MSSELERFRYGPRRFVCAECRRPWLREQFPTAEAVCDQCLPDVMARRERERQMAETTRTQQTIAQACVQLTTEFARAKSNKTAVATEVVNRFIDTIGGSEALGDILAQNYLRTCGIGLTEEEQAEFVDRPQVRQRYDQMWLSGLQKNDEFNRQSSVYETLTVEQLRSEAKETLLVLLHQDAEFRAEVFELLRCDESLLKGVLGASEVLEVSP